MFGRERRQAEAAAAAAADLRAGLNPQQLAALQTLEDFQWSLRFVRRPMFDAPIPVVVDRTGTRHAVLEADGSLNENPGFKLRS
jgi:hypothetical protein